MAERLVSVLVNELAMVIKDEIQQEVRLVVGVEDEISKLTKTFTAIQIVLKDADHKQFKNDKVKFWLKEFKDVAYDMDDILDKWRTEMLIKSQGKKKVLSFLRSLCSCFGEVYFLEGWFGEVGLRHDIGARIINIRERVELLAGEKDKYDLVETNHTHKSPDRLLTSSLIDESVVYGRHSEIDIILSNLLGRSDGSSSSSQQETSLSNPTVISIVGMGGLGKTTLAQLVFNNEQVKNHFHKTMWVCVSDPFHLPMLVEAIIKEAGGTVQNNPQWNELHNSLSESVRGKQFMLVLDDVWNEDPIKWELLALALKSGALGSRILVTTRNEKVAKIMNSTYIYNLEILSDNDCWSLISRIASVGREKQEQETLNPIGFKIAKKCKGLPLAAKALGSLLCFKNTESDWENVLKSEIWQIEEVENHFLKPALFLSYFDLPSCLKPCFTYCSIFPKDYVMKKDVLIKLWMAQGFLNSTGKRRDDLEMIGEEYFNNLVFRSFFQDIKFENGNISTCKMHDLLHDFAQFLMENECQILRTGDTLCNNKIRHLSLIHDRSSFSAWIYDKSSFNASIYKAKNLRTLQLLGMYVSKLPSILLSSFNCLRVLSLQRCSLESLSSEVEKLIHLRYLDLSFNWELKELPESITTLYNLQTIDLQNCAKLCKLPEEMWKLNNLRHINIKGCWNLKYLPQGIGKLTCLRTLNYFPLSGSSKIQELKDLNHLEGELKISWFDGMKTRKSEALEAGLKSKSHLRVLDLTFGRIWDADENSLIVEDRMNGVLEGLEPPTKLEKLYLCDYLGSKFPSWIGDKSILSNLKDLQLYQCINCIEFPALGRLPSLEKLFVFSMDKIKQIGLESYQPFGGTCGGVMREETLFPKLKELQLRRMFNLEEIFGNGVAAEELGDMNIIEIMPCLFKLVIDNCPKLKSLPRKLLNLELLVYDDSSRSLSPFPSLPKLKCLTIRDSSVGRLSQDLLALLKGLEILEIINADNLICIPEEVKHLTNLQELRIIRCKKLAPRCRKDEGVDWSTISHIPNITINCEKIQ